MVHQEKYFSYYILLNDQFAMFGCLLGNMCTVNHLLSICDVIIFEIKLSFLSSCFSTWRERRDKNVNVLRKNDEIKTIFHHFQKSPTEVDKTNFLEGGSPTLTLFLEHSLTNGNGLPQLSLIICFEKIWFFGFLWNFNTI